MYKVKIGQILLILCCFVYIIWWYRGFRPGVEAKRVSGANGVLLLITAVLGFAGVSFSLMPVPAVAEPKIAPVSIVIVGIVLYWVLLFVTKVGFHRIVTTELVLIVGWTMLEMTVINRLNAGGFLSGQGFSVMCIVITAAFVVSMILYVAYYRMEEMKAFYAAMVPLAAAAVSAAVLLWMI